MLSLAAVLSACGNDSYGNGGFGIGAKVSGGEWIWQGGFPTDSTSGVFGTKGVYGTRGMAAASNMPGSRWLSVAWTDHAGNLWLFGGLGIDSSGTYGSLNDLWTYDAQKTEWAWMSGLDAAHAYNTEPAVADVNVPAPREGAVSWVDWAGNLWLFGGGDPTGPDVGRSGDLLFNDLWRYSISTGLWTRITGSNASDAQSVCGAQDVAAPDNVPAARAGAASWTDNAGNFWLFGGFSGSYSNDLWEFNPSTDEWSCMSGTNAADTQGVYGTKGVAAPGNVPPGRANAVTWTDPAGNLWLFGGSGASRYDSGAYNDLWIYKPSTRQWTWKSGSSTLAVIPLAFLALSNAHGVYGKQGVPAPDNMPGARSGANSWSDAAGNLWLFGGGGVDSVGHFNSLNDLWMYDPRVGEWIWVNGSDLACDLGSDGDDGCVAVYGTQGAASPSNVPLARSDAVSWSDYAGNVWLFGGQGTGVGFLNDFWEYQRRPRR